MKALMVNSNYPDGINNWAPWNKRSNIALSKTKGLELEIIVPRPYTIPIKSFKLNNISKIPLKEIGEEGPIHYPRFLYMVPKSIFYGMTGNSYQQSVAKYICNNIKKCNLIHAHHAYIDGYGVIPVSRKWKVPLIVDIHSDTTIKVWTKGIILKNHFFKTLDHSSKIICISKRIFKLAQKIGINESKLEFVPLGVDINKFRPRKTEKIRKQFGVKEEKVILYVGQLIKRKGVNIFLKAISQLDKMTMKKCKFVIVGEGPEKNNLINLSKELQIRDKILFTEQVNEEDLTKWYSLADIFILPSLSEGRPTVINEAMSSECAIIASKISGIPEQVKHGYNGYLVEPNRPELLSKYISNLVSDEEKMKRMSKNSRKRIINNKLTWPDYANRIVEIYKEIVELAQSV